MVDDARPPASPGHAARPGVSEGPSNTKFDPKKADGYFYYANYYAIQAMYQSGNADFQAWYPKIASRLLALQKPDGSWSFRFGDKYATSMAILILGVPYRYLPIYQR